MLNFNELEKKYVIGKDWEAIRNINFLNRLKANISMFEKLRKFYKISVYENIYKELKKTINEKQN